MPAPATVKLIRDAMYVLAICLWSGDGQVSFIRRRGLRYRVELTPLYINMRYTRPKLISCLDLLENWGYIYNINKLNCGEIRFSINLPKYLTLGPGEDIIDLDNNYK